MRALVLALLVACSSSKGNELPPEAWSIADYTQAGVPATDHTWTHVEHGVAAHALAAATSGHPERLPRMNGAKSGAVFARMIERTPVENDITPNVQTLISMHLDRFEALNAMSKLYVQSQVAAPSPEYLALAGRLLHESSAISQQIDPFIASFGPDDPKREGRLAGLAKMRSGWSTMLLGGLMVLADGRVAEPTRLMLAADVRDTFPVLYPQLDAAGKTLVRDQLVKLHDGLKAGALRDALPSVPEP